MLLVFLPSAVAAVVLNEVLPNPDGVDGGSEWVELYNNGTSPVSLNGWTLEAGTASFVPKATLGAVTLGPGEWLLIGEEDVLGADVTLASGVRLALGNASSSGDAVRLVDGGGTVIDTLIYGPDNSDGFADDTGGTPTTVVAAPGSGVSLARSPDGVDTNAAADFVNAAPPSPGQANEAVLADCDPATVRVRINEFLPDPAGADTDAEWVELVGPPTVTVNLSGWRIEAGTSSWSTASTLPAGTLLPAGDRLVVAQSNAVPADVIAPGFVLGNASNADAVRLVDCNGLVADTIVYGTHNSDGWLDDNGQLAALAPAPVSGESLARQPDASDSNDSTFDFLSGFPTPGVPNDQAPPDCGGPRTRVVINEFLTNPEGADDGLEWVEILHAGSESLDLDGWALQGATGSSWSPKITFAAESLEPGDRLLIGGEDVPEATHVLSGALGNGSGGDGLRLVDCAGIVVDTVVYGTSNDDGLLDDDGEAASSLAPVPPEAGSVQRTEDGVDTDRSGLDFVISAAPSPGAPNPVVAPIACVPSAGGVVINEILPDPEGTDDGLEWVELVNTTSDVLALDGWSIAAGTSDYATLDVVFAGSTLIEPGGFLVVGGALVPEVDIVADGLSLGNGSTSRDGIRLFDCEGTSVDTVVYGALDEEEPDEGIVDDEEQLAASYGEPESGLSVHRVADGLDTNAANDWAVGRPTPGATNVVEIVTPLPPEVPSGCGGGSGPRTLAPPPGEPGGEAPSSTGCIHADGRLAGAWLVVALCLVRRRSGPSR